MGFFLISKQTLQKLSFASNSKSSLNSEKKLLVTKNDKAYKNGTECSKSNLKIEKKRKCL